MCTHDRAPAPERAATTLTPGATAHAEATAPNPATAGASAKEEFIVGLYIALVVVLALVYPIHKRIEQFWEVRVRITPRAR